MIVWQGLGFLAVLMPVILVVLAQMVFGQGVLETTKYGNESVVLASAILVWLVGTKLNSAAARDLIDPKTNERVTLKNKHTIFWVPMQWFAVVLAGAAVFMFSKHFV